MISPTGSARLDALLLTDPELRYHVERKIRSGQTRSLEVFLALILVVYGVVLLWPIPSFTTPGYRIIASFVTENTCGSISIAAGVVRLLALWINGRRSITPLPRLLGCLGGFAFWLGLSIGFWLAIPPLSTALAIYPVLALAEMWSSRRIGGDIFISDSLGIRPWLRRRRAARAARKDVSEVEAAGVVA